MNINENLKIVNLEKTGCKRGHIVQCLADNTKHDAPKYAYFGTRVQRGTVALHTVNGDFVLKFRAENGWLTYAEVLS